MKCCKKFLIFSILYNETYSSLQEEYHKENHNENKYEEKSKIKFIGGPIILFCRFPNLVLEIKSCYEYDNEIKKIYFIKPMTFLSLIIYIKSIINLGILTRSLLYYDSYVTGCKANSYSFSLMYIYQILPDSIFLILILIFKNIYKNSTIDYISKNSPIIIFALLNVNTEEELLKKINNIFYWLMAPQLYGLIEKILETYIYYLNYKKLQKNLIDKDLYNNKEMEEKFL